MSPAYFGVFRFPVFFKIDRLAGGVTQGRSWKLQRPEEFGRRDGFSGNVCDDKLQGIGRGGRAQRSLFPSPAVCTLS